MLDGLSKKEQGLISIPLEDKTNERVKYRRENTRVPTCFSCFNNNKSCFLKWQGIKSAMYE